MPMNILIVENDITIASVLTGLIEMWGYNVEKASNGKQALKRVKQTTFGLVLLDIFLPDIKGYELIPQLKELCPEIGIVTMTSYNSRELEMKVRNEGILYYMIMPFDIASLEELLNHISQKYDHRKSHAIDFLIRKEVRMRCQN